MANSSTIAGRVIGTEDATPLEFWVAVAEGQFLQLDDVVALERELPSGESVSIYGLVTQVRARHEGARFDSDVCLIQDGVLPAQVSQAARVVATRFGARWAKRETGPSFSTGWIRRSAFPPGCHATKSRST